MTYAEERAARRHRIATFAGIAARIAIAALLALSVAWLAHGIHGRATGDVSSRVSQARMLDGEAATLRDKAEAAEQKLASENKDESAKKAGDRVAADEDVIGETGINVSPASSVDAAKADLAKLGISAPTVQADSLEWTFLSTAGYDGGKMPVCWKCADGTGRVLAYMTATYDSDSGTFSDAAIWKAV